MLKITFLSFVVLLGIYCCSKKIEKPLLTLDEHAHQCTVLKGVLIKLLNEMDHNRMHEVALALESTRAAKCTAIDEECDIYGKALSVVIQATKNGQISTSDKLLVVKLVNDLDTAMIRGQGKLSDEWKKYELQSKQQK